MSSENPTLEEARAHRFLKAGPWSGKTLAETWASEQGKKYIQWWMETQPQATETYRMLVVFLADVHPQAAGPAT